MVCIRREGQDVDKIMSNDDILRENRVIPSLVFQFSALIFFLNQSNSHSVAENAWICSCTFIS